MPSLLPPQFVDIFDPGFQNLRTGYEIGSEPTNSCGEKAVGKAIFSMFDVLDE